MEKVYDVIIIGSGPGGLTAALYSARYARKVVVITESFSGMACNAGTIENWPGIKKIAGSELINQFREHVKDYDVEFIEKRVESLSKEENLFVANTGKEKIKGKTIILSLGTKARKLKIKGEEELIGKGVSHCATCDGLFFKNKDVVVIGGSDSAAKAALYLSDIAKSVKIIYRQHQLRCEGIYCKRISEKKNIEIIYHAIPLEITGENKVEGILIKENETEKELKCDGVFIEIGAHPCSELACDLEIECNDKGYVKTTKETKTNIDGAFAVGDMTDTPLRQVITAAAEGAIAANQAHEYLQGH